MSAGWIVTDEMKAAMVAGYQAGRPVAELASEAGVDQSTVHYHLARTPDLKRRNGGPIDHGTPGGYKRHRRAGQQACPECRAAVAAYVRSRRSA